MFDWSVMHAHSDRMVCRTAGCGKTQCMYCCAHQHVQLLCWHPTFVHYGLLLQRMSTYQCMSMAVLNAATL